MSPRWKATWWGGRNQDVFGPCSEMVGSYHIVDVGYVQGALLNPLLTPKGFGDMVRTYTISRSAAVVPRSNCERRRRCSSRYCWPTRGANNPKDNVFKKRGHCRPREMGSYQYVPHSRYYDAFLKGCLVPGNGPPYQQEDQCQYEKSANSMSFMCMLPCLRGKYQPSDETKDVPAWLNYFGTSVWGNPCLEWLYTKALMGRTWPG